MTNARPLLILKISIDKDDFANTDQSQTFASVGRNRTCGNDENASESERNSTSCPMKECENNGWQDRGHVFNVEPVCEPEMYDRNDSNRRRI
jgi:hypothetical protein